jgi:allophanate hydrolase subunit 1
MTSVEIQFRYATPPTEAATFALANIREVYGIRRLKFDQAARTLTVEYDATRLNAAAIAKLVRQAGLEIDAELPLIPPAPAPEPAPTA